MAATIEETASAEAGFAAAEALYRARAYSEAAAQLRPLAAAHPERADLLRLLGLCHVRLHDLPAGLDLLQRACALAPNDPYTRLHLGVGLHEGGQFHEAAALFRACARDLPNDPAPSLNLSATLLQLGDIPGARHAARRARLLAPQLPQAHYTLGLVLLAAGMPAQAADAFAHATRLDPRFADAWVNLGLARYRQFDIHAAIACMRQALAADPAHRAAAGNLGALLRLAGSVEEAEHLLQSTIARDPQAAEARANLAVGLLQEERADEALALLDGELPQEPSLRRHWQAQRCLALLQFGRAAEARSLLQQIETGAALSISLLWRRVLLALAEAREADARAAAEQMERAIQQSEDALPEHRIMAHFDLAKFWSGRGEPDRAFPFWVRGHALLGRLQPFSRDACRAFVDASIAQFDRARLHNGARAANCDAAPVFIVGMPRSGTTLTEQIVAAHPAAFGAGERNALGQAFAALGGDWQSAEAVARVAAQPAETLTRTAERYLAELHALAPDAERVIDKMPGNLNYLGLIALLLPGARIIHCARDPRDVGLSIFTFRFYGHHPYAHDLGDLGWYIAQHERLMAHWRAVVPNPILTVRLDDWVRDFHGTLARVLHFLDLPYDAACERFYAANRRVRTVSRAQVAQPVNARGLGRWRPYAAHLAPLIAELEAAGMLPDAASSS